MKKIVSILIAVAMLMSLAASVFATDSAIPTVTVESATAEVGEQITLSVSVSAVTICAYGLQVDYDAAALELVSIDKGSQSLGFFVGNLGNGKVTDFTFADTTVEGVLFTLTFNVLAAGEHTVDIVIDSFNTADQAVVEVEAVAGTVTVAGAEVPTLTVESATAEVGEQITLNVSISAATIAAYGLQVVYDETALELVSIDKGDESLGFCMGNVSNGKVTDFTFTDTAVEGVLFTLTFNVLAAGEHTVDIVIDSFNTADEAVVEVEAVAGIITAEGGVPHECEFVETERVEPTCAEDGYVVYTCTCGETYTEVLPATGEHNYVESERVEPTCAEDGYVVYTCACGATYTETIPATDGHVYGETERVEPSCAEDGYIVWTCVCGNSYTEILPATGEHNYVESERVEPSCAEDGYVVYTCGCGDTYTEVLPATGVHNYVESERVEPSCAEDGYVVYTCGCGETYTEVLPATGEHNYATETERVEPTCTVDGYVIWSCGCGATYTEVLPATGEHVYTETERVDATCGADGYITYTCACGASYTETLAATGEHVYTETERVEATCTEDGYVVYTCACGASYTETLAATGHNMVATESAEPTCCADGFITYYCECGYSDTEILPATGEHIYTETERVEATCCEDGYVVYTCQNCPDTYTEVIPATNEHTFVDGVCVDCGAVEGPAGTGDLNIMAIALIAAMSAAAVVVTSRKKED